MDINVVAENLTELLTNTVNMTSVFYDIFLNPEPMDVSLQQYNSDNELITVVIPNRAKDRLYYASIVGEGSPEGIVEGAIGATYIDTLNNAIYVKTQDAGEPTGWAELLDENTATPIIQRYLQEHNYITIDQIASRNTPGIVKFDGTTISMNANNQLVAVGGGGGTGGSATSILDQNETARFLWIGTQEDYNAIENKSNTVFYVITNA